MARASGLQNKMTRRSADEAASMVAQARAGLQFAQVQLGYATITAPISGVVTSRMVDPGDTVSPGVPIITVEDDSLYRLEADVPDKDAGRLSIGQTVSVSIGSENVTCEGKVAVIAPSGDPSSRKFVVKVNLPKSAAVRSGNFGRLSFATGNALGVIVPEAALRDEGGLTFVFVVGKDDRAQMRVLKPGRKMDDGIEIISGLNAGDRVIVSNTGVLADGLPVRVREAGNE